MSHSYLGWIKKPMASQTCLTTVEKDSIDIKRYNDLLSIYIYYRITGYTCCDSLIILN